MTKGIVGRNPLMEHEKQFIRDNCLTMTDKAIAERLCRDPRTIQKYRKALRVEKKQGGKVIRNKLFETDGDVVKIDSKKVNKKDYYKLQVQNSIYYQELKKQLSQDELKYYVESWGDLSQQFSDVIQTEKRQIDELIKAEILGNRILRDVKVLEEEREEYAKKIDEFRQTHDLDGDDEEAEKAQERDDYLMHLVRVMSSASNAMSQEYQKTVDIRRRIIEDLNARRKDRVSELQKSGSTFLGLVEAFRQNDVRETQGRHIELIKQAKEHKQKQWRSPQIFPDGTREPYLLDTNTKFADELMQQDLLSNPMPEDIEALDKLFNKGDDHVTGSTD